MTNHEPATNLDSRRGIRILITTAVITFIVAIGITALLVNIFEKKQEARIPYIRPVVAVNDTTDDPATWGKNFPQEYDLYKKTREQSPTKFGGSKMVIHVPTTDDPRTMVTQERIEEDPRLKEIWAGYAFSVDYRKKRGHEWMLEDQQYTQRQHFAKQPGTCIHCHGSVYTLYKEQGNGDLIKGFEKVNPMPYMEVRKMVKHPLACIDCHDPQTMQLRVTRPGFIEGIRALKASQGILNYDVNTMATRQEMRSYVCGQCHVEYYFQKPDKRLVYPWAKGVNFDNIVSYYDDIKFFDWVHAETGAQALKAQHPEFEMWSQGIHARSGVACADCHMPYRRVGATKVSDHQVRSPLLNVNRACQTCHKWDEQELKSRVEQIQERKQVLSNQAMNAVIDLIHDINAAKASGASDADMAAARDFQRKAQFAVDFVEAENSNGFHAPQEAERILGEAIDYSRQGQLSLRVLKTPTLKVAAAK